MKRDSAVDILKCIAVLLIVNSHFDPCYPEGLASLATGGAIGNALFFFCSGYTLFLGRTDGFVPWYKRRLMRILPSFLVCSIICSYILDEGWWKVAGGYWFIRCILVHYVVLYLVQMRLLARKCLTGVLLAAAIVGCWLVFEEPDHDIYQTGYFMWVHYFACSLCGLYVAERRASSATFAYWGPAMALLGTVGYYGIRGVALRHAGLGWLQLFAVPSVALAAYGLFRTAHAVPLERLMEKTTGKMVRIIGGLCLETYMMHFLFATPVLREYFPLNLIGAFVVSFAAAYAARCLSRFMVQTFDSRRDYDFPRVFGLE